MAGHRNAHRGHRVHRCALAPFARGRPESNLGDTKVATQSRSNVATVCSESSYSGWLRVCIRVSASKKTRYAACAGSATRRVGSTMGSCMPFKPCTASFTNTPSAILGRPCAS
eukprot:9491225-Pyramimonas_sp.AAC.2